MSHSIFYIRFLARPLTGSHHYESVGGAYVSCYIDAQTETEARLRSKLEIEKAGYSIEREEDLSAVDTSCYTQKDLGREFYEQCLIDKEVLVFQTWPNGLREDTDH